MNVRVVNPVYHVVLSWPAGESPDDGQAFACGLHAIQAVGMAGHQYVQAIHRDTGNVHLHIAVNRVNPETYASVYPSRDFYKLDRAMRELELAYGWQHDNGPFAVFERDGKQVVDWASKAPSSKEKMPTAAADMERFGDQESLFSYARGAPRQAVVAALKNKKLTWQQLHAVLARYGLAIREKGQGLAIHDMKREGTTPIKASDMHEQLSRARLVKRMGSYEAVDPSSPLPAKVVAAYDKNRPPRRDPAMREERREERAAARRDLLARYNQYKKARVIPRLDPEVTRQRYAAVRDSARRQRAEVRTAMPDAKSRKAMYSIIAFETLRARELLRRDIAREREALRADPANQRQPYREWVEHQAALGDNAAISQLRGLAYTEKRHAKALAQALGDDGSDGIRPEVPMDPSARDLPDGFYYRVRRDGAVVYRSGKGLDAFVDHGQRIEMTAKGESAEASLAIALRMATEKYGGAFELTGSEAFKKLAIRIIVEQKLRVQLKDARQEALRDAMASETQKPVQPRRMRH